MSNFGYDDSGGFNNDGGGGGGSQNTPSKPRRNYEEQTLIPVTIKMLLDAISAPGDGADFQLKDMRPLHMIKVVGAVRSAEDRSTNLYLDLEDGTGLISVKIWVNDGDDCSAIVQMRTAAAQENAYVRIIGQLKEFDGQRQIVANDVRVAEGGNEITYHFLEVAHSFDKHSKGGASSGGVGIGGGMGYGIGNMASNPPPMQQQGVSAQGGQAMDGGNALNDAVLRFIQSAGGECCASFSFMHCELSATLSFSIFRGFQKVSFLSNLFLRDICPPTIHTIYSWQRFRMSRQ